MAVGVRIINRPKKQVGLHFQGHMELTPWKGFLVPLLLPFEQVRQPLVSRSFPQGRALLKTSVHVLWLRAMGHVPFRYLGIEYKWCYVYLLSLSKAGYGWPLVAHGPAKSFCTESMLHSPTIFLANANFISLCPQNILLPVTSRSSGLDFILFFFAGLIP